MTYEEIAQCLLGFQSDDYPYMFEDMSYDTFEEAVNRVKENGGDLNAESVVYEAISYGLEECFGDVVDDVYETFEIRTNYMDSGVGADEDEMLAIPDFDERNDRFYEMTGFEIMY